MNTLESIHKHLQTQKSHIVSGIAMDPLKKSEVAEAFRYSSNVKITKTGKQLAEALEKASTKCDAEIVLYTKEMNDALKLCTVAPTKNMSRYMLKGYGEKIGFVPKMFEWDDCSTRVYDKASERSIDKDATSVAQAKCCDTYNSKARAYVRKCVDKCTIDTIKNGIEPNKKYELTPEQAAVLGF